MELDRRSMLIGATAALVSACYRDGGEPQPGASGVLPPDFRDIAPEGPRAVLDPSRIPPEFREAPMLAAAVAAGRLPPVRERIGRDPLVIEPLREIGRYGGTLHRAINGPNDIAGVVRFASGPDSFLYWDHLWTTPRPNIARDYALSHDGRVLTLFLRRGMRWSDGAPFSADDVLFWYEDLYLDRRVVAAPSESLRVDGQDVLVRKVDLGTVQFIAPAPFPLLIELLASFTDIGGPSFYGREALGGFAPKHYLSRFHPKYRSEDAINREAREAGLANWSIYLKKRFDWTFNPELPVVSPWRVTAPINSRKFGMERNPYSIWVDTDGNQLPYIDRIAHVLCSGPEAVNFKAAAGQLDFQSRHLLVSNVPFLLATRERSDCDVHLNPSRDTDLGIRINLSYRLDPEIGDLLGDVRFRRALSLGIDRREVNETFMLGLGLPTASVPTPESRYYPGTEWARRWAVHDVDAANGLLDEVGLSARDAEGFRLRRDRSERLRLTCQAFVAHFDFPAVAEMVREHWERIGIDLDTEIVDPTLAIQQSMAGELQLSLQLSGAADPFMNPEYLFPYTPVGIGGASGVEFARWFQTNGSAGERPPDEIVEVMELWRAARLEGPERRTALGRELIRRHVDNVFSIGLVSGGFTYHGVHIRKRGLRNVPRRVVNSQVVRSPANGLPMTFFFA